MAQLFGGSQLAKQAIERRTVSSQVAVNYLDGDFSAHHQASRLVNDSAGTFSDDRVDYITVVNQSADKGIFADGFEIGVVLGTGLHHVVVVLVTSEAKFHSN